MTTDTKIWEKIAAPIPQEDIQWRVDGKPTARDGKYFARYVAYVDAQFVRDRLDSIVPGNWDLTLELMPFVDVINQNGVVTGKEYSFKARLQIMGTIREDVGSGDDYKSAASDALKRAAVRYGVAHELYSFEQNWVEVDGDGKYAKPVEDPQKAYERRHGSGAKKEGSAVVPATAEGGNANLRAAASPKSSGPSPDNPAPGVAAGGASPYPALDVEPVSCPQCGGRMWDNRLTKRNPKQPDYKCQNRSCNGVIWPPKPTDPKRPVVNTAAREETDEEYVARVSLDVEADSATLPF